MSSLWTPGGEHEVPREQPSPEPAPESLGDIPGYDELTPEQQEQATAMAAELAEARRRIAEVPAAEVVANHLMGLYELGAIHLSTDPPAPQEAQVAIDAMTAVLHALEGRLGENEAVLNNALQQLQLAFVQVARGEAGDADETNNTGS